MSGVPNYGAATSGIGVVPAGLQVPAAVHLSSNSELPLPVSRPASPVNGAVPNGSTNGHGKDRPSFFIRATNHLSEVVDASRCNKISVYACFLTGFTSAISFTACYVWPGFQTGNLAQLGIALARNFDPLPTRTVGLQIGDKQALVALTSFWLGTSLGHVGERIGNRRRVWLVLAGFIECVMVAIAAGLAHASGEGPYAKNRYNPAWTTSYGLAALSFLSASLGLQAIIGKRIGSPMNTTVVLTTTWVEIFNEPSLLVPKRVPSRDIRVAGVAAVFIGAFASRGLLGVIGGDGTVGVLCGLRIISMIWWGIVPAKKA